MSERCALRRLAVLALPLLAVSVATACGSSAAEDGSDPSGGAETLVFGAVPSENATSLEKDYEPIVALLEEETGAEVEFFQATSYAGIIEAQITGKVDIAQYGPLSYVIAQNNGADVTAIAAQVQEKGEEPGYQSYAITRPDTGITSLEDYAGKTVCFVDEASTSGFLYPSAGLLDAGVDPQEDVTPVFAGGHDASALSVASGDCDAGFAFDTMVDKQLVDTGQIAPGDLEVIWKSETIPGSPVAISNDLPDDVQQTLTTAFQEKANSDHLSEQGLCSGECRLGDEGAWGYAEVDDAFYEPVREVCDATKAEQCTDADAG